MKKTTNNDRNVGGGCDKQRIKNILACICSMLLVISAPIFLQGYWLLEYNLSIAAINLVFLSNVLYAYLNIRRRIVFLIFNICMWVFLISRPTISMLRGDEWWYFDTVNVKFALVALYITLLSLLCGCALAQHILKHRGEYRFEHTQEYCVIPKKQSEFNRSLQIISGALFIVCFLCKMAVGVEKIVFMSGKEYYEYYVSYESSFPYFFNTVASMMPYALCVFLAAMPKKKYAYTVLILYVVSTVPNLMIGIRNDIVLALIFSFLYFFIRDYFEATKHWIGRFERTACIIVIPFALVFLGAYNYIRDSAEYQSSAVSLIVDLFYKQGVSFDVLCIGFAAIPNLPSVVPKNYTFGNAIDYIKTNVISRKLFGTQPLGDGNNEYRAIYGNDFSHSMSYVARDDYLDGHGYGSSFILETFADFGYIGIIIFSILLGMLMIYMLHLLRKSRMWRVVVFMALTQFFFMPRASATGCFTFVIYIQFWIPIAAIYLLAALINKKYDIVRPCKENGKSLGCVNRVRLL